jgi:hypothetical protein
MNILVKGLSPAKITKTLVGTHDADLSAHFKDED